MNDLLSGIADQDAASWNWDSPWESEESDESLKDNDESDHDVEAKIYNEVQDEETDVVASDLESEIEIFEAKINIVQDSLKELRKGFYHLKCSGDKVVKVKETLVFKNKVEEAGGIEAFEIFEANINGVEDSMTELLKSFCNLKCSGDKVVKVKEIIVFKNKYEGEELKSNDHKEYGGIASLAKNEEQGFDDVAIDKTAQLELVKNDDEKEPSEFASGSTSQAQDDAINDLVQKILQEEEELAKRKLKKVNLKTKGVLEKDKVKSVSKKLKDVNLKMNGVLENSKNEVEPMSKKQEKKKKKMEYKKKREEEEAKKKKKSRR